MSTEIISRAAKLEGSPVIPGDKSISHRGLIFGALAEGKTRLRGLLQSEDVQSTARCLKMLGVSIVTTGKETMVEGLGGRPFQTSKEALDCGNSGTTMRLMMGVLAGQSMKSTLMGDASLSRRPMKRVAEPLELMGARFSLSQGNFAPLEVYGSKLRGLEYSLKVASAQIKSAILLAGIQAEGMTLLRGEIQSRDHTERMLRFFGAEVESREDEIKILGGQKLSARTLEIPGDPSTAAFWIAAAALVPGSKIEVANICLNPSRIGFLKVLERMGACLEIEMTSQEPEPVGKIKASFGKLQGTLVSKFEIPHLIDEIPMLAVVASQSHGKTVVEGAEELRVKESDRLAAIATNLKAMGIEMELRHDGFVIDGPQKLKGARLESFYDHRIAMAFSIAGLVASEKTTLLNSECVSISYPDFFKTLNELTNHV